MSGFLAPIVRPPLRIEPETTVQTVQLLEALPEMPGFSGSPQAGRERVIMSRQLGTRFGLDRRRQVLVQIDSAQLKLMSAATYYGLDVDAVYVTRDGLDEIHGLPGVLDFPQTVTIGSAIPFSVDRVAAEANAGMFQEGTDLAGSTPPGFFVNGIHGGSIEVGSDIQADECAARLNGVHGRAGYVFTNAAWASGVQSGNDRWHVTAVDFLDHLWTQLPPRTTSYAVGASFHGYVAVGGQADILIGGLAQQANKDILAADLVAALSGTGLTVDADDLGDHEDGDAPDNVTNRYVPGGDTYQLEQTFAVRNNPTWRTIVADTVADFLHTQRLPA